MDFKDFITATVVTYNSGKKAEKICNQLLKYTKKYPFKLYVVDNNSTDNTVELLNHVKGISVIKNSENKGFATGHNTVFENVGKYHFVINPDIEISRDILSEIADFMENNPHIAMLNPTILNPDGSIQQLPKKRPTFKRLFLGRIFPAVRREYTSISGENDTVFETDFCSGCFFCIRGEIFKYLGGFDENFFMYMEDADLTLRAKNYGKTVVASQFSITHQWERQSAKSLKLFLIHLKSSIKFLVKWGKEK